MLQKKTSPVSPEDQAYTVWNNRGVNERFSGRPDSIYPVKNTVELKAILQLATDTKKRVTVRGGGHCLENFVSNTAIELLIDISEMKGVRFDEHMQAFEIMAGTTVGEMYEQLDLYWGVLVPAGEHPAIGIGGHISGGAFGFVCRQYGLAVDYLQAVEVLWVNKDGKVETTVADRESKGDLQDLYWAHTGGGAGNFGIVTRYWFSLAGKSSTAPEKLLPAAPKWVETFELEFAWSQFTEDNFIKLVSNFGDWCAANVQAGLPATALFCTLHLWHKITKKIQVKGLALPYDGEDLITVFISSLLNNTGLKHKLIRQKMSWLDFVLQPFPDIFVPGRSSFKVKDAFMCHPFSSGQIKIMYKYLTERGNQVAGGSLGHATYGGRVNIVAPEATASYQRNAVMTTSVTAGWKEKEAGQVHLQWARDCYQAIFATTGGVPAHSGNSGGCIINHPDADLADLSINQSGIAWHELYYHNNYQRLQKTKSRWDPLYIFQHVLGVEPEGG